MENIGEGLEGEKERLLDYFEEAEAKKKKRGRVNGDAKE